MPAYRYHTRFESIIDDLAERVDAIVDEAADQVQARAKARVPVNTARLKNSIHAEKTENGVSVVAGDTDVFYGHLVEFGEASYPARPFMVPAVEESRETVAREARRKLRDL